MSYFWGGFEKRALHDKRLHEDLAVAGSYLLPSGDVIHKSVREGREGKRFGDFAFGLLGSIAGATAGGALAGPGGAIAGYLAGAVMADRMRTEKDYGPDGHRILPMLQAATPEPAHNSMSADL